MSGKKPTKLIVKKKMNKETREQMEKRAARFGLLNDGSSVKTTTAPSTTKSVNSEEAAKLAARAARFADVKPSPDATTTKKATLSGSSGTTTTSTTTSTTSGVDKDLMAKRAARFANVAATSTK